MVSALEPPLHFELLAEHHLAGLAAGPIGPHGTPFAMDRFFVVAGRTGQGLGDGARRLSVLAGVPRLQDVPAEPVGFHHARHGEGAIDHAACDLLLSADHGVSFCSFKSTLVEKSLLNTRISFLFKLVICDHKNLQCDFYSIKDPSMTIVCITPAGLKKPAGVTDFMEDAKKDSPVRYFVYSEHSNLFLLIMFGFAFDIAEHRLVSWLSTNFI